MGKKNKQPAYLSRPEKRGPPGPTPLLVLAGLPQATALPAAATITNDPQSRWRAVAVPFPKRDEAIYLEPPSILELGRLACEFAIDGAVDPDGVPTPSRIALAYVAGEGFERLLDVFGHAVLPLPLSHPDWTWPNGRHWRHEIESVNLLLSRAQLKAEAEEAEALRLRLEARRSDDVLLLPGRNFHLGPEHRLSERFSAFMSGALDAAGVEEGIRIERFAFERLSPYYKRVGGRGKRFAIDSRDIVFAKSHVGQHGAHHNVTAGQHIDASVLRRVLEARYRFGTPLEPEGFQHDAQREKGQVLDNEMFDCVIKGAFPVSDDHANVFPSDVVT